MRPRAKEKTVPVRPCRPVVECVKSLGLIVYASKCPETLHISNVPGSHSLQASVFAIVPFHTFAKTTAPSPLRQNHATRPSTSRKHLVTVLGELLPDLAVDRRALLGVDELLLESPLALVVGRALDLSPLLEPATSLVFQPFSM